MSEQDPRPHGITALSIFFFFGALMSFIAGASLLFQDSILKRMWRLNPRAHEGLVEFGRWAPVLFFVVSVGCALAGVGLWRRQRWGYWLAVALISINLIANTANGLIGNEPRTVVGVPIAGAIIFYLLTKRVRHYFTG